MSLPVSLPEAGEARNTAKPAATSGETAPFPVSLASLIFS